MTATASAGEGRCLPTVRNYLKRSQDMRQIHDIAAEPAQIAGTMRLRATGKVLHHHPFNTRPLTYLTELHPFFTRACYLTRSYGPLDSTQTRVKTAAARTV